MLDFELYDEFFAHPLDFRWHSHVQQLEVRGHNLTYAVFEEQPPSGNVYAATDFAAAYADTSVLHILQVSNPMRAANSSTPCPTDHLDQSCLGLRLPGRGAGGQPTPTLYTTIGT